MTEAVSAGLEARTDEEGPPFQNNSGCYVCGAPAAGVRVAGNKRVPVCEDHAATDPREGDTVVYEAGIRCRGTVIGRTGETVRVVGVAEETITVGQVLAIVDRDGGPVDD